MTSLIFIFTQQVLLAKMIVQANIFQSSSLEIQACLQDIKQYKSNPDHLMMKESYRDMTSNQNYSDSQKVNQCLKCIPMNRFKQAVCHCCLIGDKAQRNIMINSLQAILGFAIAKNQQEELNAPHKTIQERNTAIEGVMKCIDEILQKQKKNFILPKKEETVLDKAKHLLTIWGGIMPDLRALEGFRDIIRRQSNQPESKQSTEQIDEEIKNKLNKGIINSMHSSQEQEEPAEKTLSVLANMLQVSSQTRRSDRLRQIQAAVSTLLQKQHISTGHIEDALRAEKQQSLNLQQHIATVTREKQRMAIEYNKLKQERDNLSRRTVANSGVQKEEKALIERMSAENIRLKESLAKLEGENIQLKELLAKLEGKNNRSLAEVEGQNKRLTKLEKEKREDQRNIEELRRTLNDCSQRAEDLRKENDRLNRQMSSLTTGSRDEQERLTAAKEGLEEQVRTLETQMRLAIVDHERLVGDLQKALSDYERQVESAKEQKDGLEEEVRNLREEMGRIKDESRRTVNGLERKIVDFEREIKTLNAENDRLTQQVASQKSNRVAMSDYESQRKSANRLQQEQMGRLKEQIRKLTDKIRGLQASQKEKQQEIRRLKAQVSKLSQKLGAAEGQRSRLAGELQAVNSKFGATDKQQFHHRYSQIMQEYTQVWAILSDISSTLNMPNSQSHHALTHMHTLITQLNNIQHKISAMAGQLQRKNVPTSSASTNTCPTYSENMETQTEGQQKPEHGLSMKHFAGNLMDGFSYDENNDSGVGFEQERKFLVNCIEDVEKKPIRITRLLFRFDPLTETKNFHKFIDDRPQWVLLIKLTNNYMIAGYSNLALLPGLVNQGPGFLASLTNAVCLFRDERIKESKLVVYDSYFIIFGSSEIRLKLSERKVVSNLGAAHHSFRTKQKSAKILLGIEQKEMDVEQFEIHQIYF